MYRRFGALMLYQDRGMVEPEEEKDEESFFFRDAGLHETGGPEGEQQRGRPAAPLSRWAGTSVTVNFGR